MPQDVDYAAFRKYVGDFTAEAIDESDIDAYLDDATVEASAPHTDSNNPIITSYDNLPARYSPEVILLAAINWWWNKIGQYSDKISTTVGQASEQASERWQHAMEVVQTLYTLYQNIAVLGQLPDQGNLSHWDRSILVRIGGEREEDAAHKIWPNSF